MSTSTPPDAPARGRECVGSACVYVDPWVQWPFVTWCAFTTDPDAAYHAALSNAEAVRPPTAPTRMLVSGAVLAVLDDAEHSMRSLSLQLPDPLVAYAAGRVLPHWTRLVVVLRAWDRALRIISDPDQAKSAWWG